MNPGTFYNKNNLLRFFTVLLFCGMVFSFSSSALAQCGFAGGGDYVCQQNANGAITNRIFQTIDPGYSGTPTGPGVPIDIPNLLDQMSSSSYVSPNLQAISDQIQLLIQNVRMPEFEELMAKLSLPPPQGCPGLIPLAAQVIGNHADALGMALEAAQDLPPAVQDALTIADFISNPLADPSVQTYIYPSPNYHSVTVLGQLITIPASSC